MQPNSRQYLWDILLYSGLGCFSYFFLVRFADIPLRYQDRLLTPEAFVAVCCCSTAWGWACATFS